MAAGLSISELAKMLHYSKGYLSKIENDLRAPSLTLARHCDAVLNTGGELSSLVAPVQPGAVGEDGADDDVWVLAFDDGELRFHQIDRRSLHTGASTGLGFAMTRGTRPTINEDALSGLRASFDQLRALGRITSPLTVLPQVIAQTNTLRALAVDSPEPIRSELLRLASRSAEYAGWMSQEAGDDRGAVWWTRLAVTLAGAGGDQQLGNWALLRHAEIALYRYDALSTIDLARQAQADPYTPPRILGQAARCEAQGHALAGALDNYLRALDTAAQYLAQDDATSNSGPVLGSTADNQISLARGWSLCDLGRPAESAEVLDLQVARIPETARRVRARFGARRILAHAQSDDIEHACSLAPQVLYDAAQVDSATVRIDLRQLVRTLSRWRSHATVQEIYPELLRQTTFR